MRARNTSCRTEATSGSLFRSSAPPCGAPHTRAALSGAHEHACGPTARPPAAPQGLPHHPQRCCTRAATAACVPWLPWLPPLHPLSAKPFSVSSRAANAATIKSADRNRTIRAQPEEGAAPTLRVPRQNGCVPHTRESRRLPALLKGRRGNLSRERVLKVICRVALDEPQGGLNRRTEGAPIAARAGSEAASVESVAALSKGRRRRRRERCGQGVGGGGGTRGGTGSCGGGGGSGGGCDDGRGRGGRGGEGGRPHPQRSPH